MSHSLNLGDVGGPRALGCGSFKLDPALFHAFLQMAFQSEKPVSQASQASQANVFLLPHQPVGEGGGAVGMQNIYQM